MHPWTCRCVAFLCLVVITAWLVSCGSPRGAGTAEDQLLDQFRRWEGTPYALGGTTRSGVDCSAFVQIAMNEALGIRIPRTTRQQLRYGERIRPASVRIGDLVFFQTGRTTYHVGIMLRGDFFMHASTSRGVTIDRLNDPYWQERMIQIRRVTGG